MTKEICELKHDRFNSILVSDCRELGGRFDRSECKWVFHDIVKDRVQKLEDLYNSELITIEITAKSDLTECHGTVEFIGYTIARAFGRDSGAKLGDGVYMTDGKIRSCGSVKNWCSQVVAGSVFRLEVPRALYAGYKHNEDDYWEMKELNGNTEKNIKRSDIFRELDKVLSKCKESNLKQEDWNKLIEWVTYEADSCGCSGKEAIESYTND